MTNTIATQNATVGDNIAIHFSIIELDLMHEALNIAIVATGRDPLQKKTTDDLMYLRGVFTSQLRKVKEFKM